MLGQGLELLNKLEDRLKLFDYEHAIKTGRKPEDADLARALAASCEAVPAARPPLASSEDADLAREAGHLMHGLQWALLPFLGFTTLRNFIAALERPIWGLIVMLPLIFGATFLFVWWEQRGSYHRKLHYGSVDQGDL